MNSEVDNQPTDRYIGADDILRRAEKALALWQFSQVIAHKKIEIALNFQNQDFHRYGKLLQEMDKQGAVQQLLWEASLFIITACWAWSNNAKEHKLDGKNPAFIIEHVKDEAARENIKNLRRVRNKRVAHPAVQTQGSQAIAVGAVGGQMRPFNAWMSIQEETYYLSDDLYLQLKQKIEFTINEAKRVKKDEFHKHFQFSMPDDGS